MRARLRPGPRWPAAAVLAIGILAAVWACLGGRALYAWDTAGNDDQAVYLYQADALRHGQLAPPASIPAGSFQPWFGGLREGRVVVHYTPAPAAALAAGEALAGTPRGALAATALLLSVLTYLVAVEVLGDRRWAVATSALVVGSPLALVQLTTFLAYAPTLVLALAATWSLLVGRRTGHLRWLVAAGTAAGTALAARPFDSLLFLVPVAAGWAFELRRDLGRLVRGAVAALAGASAPMAALLLTNRAMTGDPLGLPFTLFVPDDGPGFGTRRIAPDDPGRVFTPALGVLGSASHLALLGLWCAGGPVLVALAVRAVACRPAGPMRWLALAGATLPLGFVFFWGPYNADHIWGGAARFGPFYVLPLLVPLALLATSTLSGLAPRRRALAVTALTVVQLATVAVILARAAENRSSEAALAAPLRALKASSQTPALVFTETNQGPYLLHPFGLTRNPAVGEGPIRFAVSTGADDLGVVAAEADRRPWLFRAIVDNRGGGLKGRTALEPLGVARGAEVRLRASSDLRRDATIEVGAQRGAKRYALRAGAAATVVLVGADVWVEGAEQLTWVGPAEATARIALREPGPADRDPHNQPLTGRLLDQRLVPVLPLPGGIEALVPLAGRRDGPFPLPLRLEATSPTGL